MPEGSTFEVLGEQGTESSVRTRTYADASHHCASMPCLVILESQVAHDQAEVGWFDFEGTGVYRVAEERVRALEAGSRQPVATWGSVLARLRCIEDDWDGNGAPVPNETAITNAERVVESILEFERDPDRVVQTVEGGVEVYLKRGNRYGSIECLNNGAIVAGASDRRGLVQTWPSVSDDREIGPLIRELLEFVDA